MYAAAYNLGLTILVGTGYDRAQSSSPIIHYGGMAVQVQLNRAIKNFCPDFMPIRQILTQLNATFVEAKDQEDYFFTLPSNTRTTIPRLKLRIENKQPCCVYYYDRGRTDHSLIQFQVFDIHDPAIKELLTTVLGVQTIVHKHREVWRKDNALFNLDTVDQVGQIFEVELELTAMHDHLLQAAQYSQLFKPYLGSAIVGSNEDIVPPLATGNTPTTGANGGTM